MNFISKTVEEFFELSEEDGLRMSLVGQEVVGGEMGSDDLIQSYRDVHGQPLSVFAKYFKISLKPKYQSLPAASETNQVLMTIANLHQAFFNPFNDPLGLLNQFSLAIDNIASRWDRSQYLAPHTAIVQSSGFGKSRLVCEYGRQKCFTFYVCLRPSNSSGYPKRSDIAR
jgi:hypothetical protein